MRGAGPWVLAMLLGGSALSQTAPPKGQRAPRSLLYVGNSFFYFNGGVHRMVSGLLDEGERHGEYRSTSRTRGGAALSEHDVEAYFRTIAVASAPAVGGAQPSPDEITTPLDAV